VSASTQPEGQEEKKKRRGGLGGNGDGGDGMIAGTFSSIHFDEMAGSFPWQTMAMCGDSLVYLPCAFLPSMTVLTVYKSKLSHMRDIVRDKDLDCCLSFGFTAAQGRTRDG
jgi:hypothetical protein